MKINSKLAEYISFTPKEKKGTAVLLVILIIVIGLKIYLNNKAGHNNDLSDIQLELIEGERAESEAKQVKLHTRKSSNEEELNRKRIPFNPNTASEKQLIEAGFSPFAAGNITKYRKSGGGFKSPDDLLKIYGVEQALIEELRHLMQFDNIAPAAQPQIEVSLVELNTADTLLLAELPCIGPILSKRIVKYRNLLGGYYSISQLKEVYGVDSVCFGLVKKHMHLEKSYIRTIDLNSAEEHELKSHPYIKKYQAKGIVKYRDIVGEFADINQLLINNIMSETDFIRVRPYLVVVD